MDINTIGIECSKLEKASNGIHSAIEAMNSSYIDIPSLHDKTMELEQIASYLEFIIDCLAEGKGV